MQGYIEVSKNKLNKTLMGKDIIVLFFLLCVSSYIENEEYEY